MDIKYVFTTELFNETEFVFSLINDDVAQLFFSEFDDGYFCQVCGGCSHEDEPTVSDRRDINASQPSSDSLINLRGVFKCGVPAIIGAHADA